MIDLDIKHFVMRRLLLKGEPVSATELKLSVRAAFNATLTDSELDTYLAQLEESNLVAFGKDEFKQTLVDLTPKGKMAAERRAKL